MPSMKTIKRRMTSVGTTKKIIRAMGMVAASKLQKDRARLETARSFFQEADRIAHVFLQCDSAAENPFVRRREVKSSAYILITSDRGLCGSYNAVITEKALAHMGQGKNAKVLVVGHKGYELVKREGKKILHRFDDVLETAFYEDAERIADYLIALYKSEEVDEAFVACTRFDTMLSHIPEIVRVLPIEPNAAHQIRDMKYETDVHAYLERVVRMHISAFLFAALNESSACEQAARMVNMDSATNNAEDIINKLTRAYNRGRQASITQELSEVVSGADMLK